MPRSCNTLQMAIDLVKKQRWAKDADEDDAPSESTTVPSLGRIYDCYIRLLNSE